MAERGEGRTRWEEGLCPSLAGQEEPRGSWARKLVTPSDPGEMNLTNGSHLPCKSLGGHPHPPGCLPLWRPGLLAQLWDSAVLPPTPGAAGIRRGWEPEGNHTLPSSSRLLLRALPR